MGVGDFLLSTAASENARYLCAREIQDSIRDSVHPMLSDRISEIGLSSIYNVNDREILCKQTGTTFAFTGISKVTKDKLKSFWKIKRCWGEEAHAFTDESLKVLLPTIREAGSKIYFTYNRKMALDPVHALFMTYYTDMKTERLKCTVDGKAHYWKLHRCSEAVAVEINWNGNPFFPDVLEQERARDEANLPEDEYAHIWGGAPEPQPVGAIIARAVVMEAINRPADEVGEWSLGVDVARGGKDQVTISKKKGHTIFPIVKIKKLAAEHVRRIHQTGEAVLRVLESIPGLTENQRKQIEIKIDDTGVGGGLTDWLLERGYNAIGINFNQRAHNEDKFPNAISEMWFTFAEDVVRYTLPNDEELIEDLTNRAELPRDTRGRRRVEPKDNFKKRMGRSPDCADCVLLNCYEGVRVGVDFV